MNDQFLSLHCPQCGHITEVVCEGRHLVCVECGWQFSAEVSARYLGATPDACLPEACPDRPEHPVG